MITAFRTVLRNIPGSVSYSWKCPVAQVARDGVTMVWGIPTASEVAMSVVFPLGRHWQSPSAPSLDNGYWKSSWLWTTSYFPLPIILCFFYWYIYLPWLWTTVCFLGNFDICVFLWSSSSFTSSSFTSPVKVHFLCSFSHYDRKWTNLSHSNISPLSHLSFVYYCVLNLLFMCLWKCPFALITYLADLWLTRFHFIIFAFPCFSGSDCASLPLPAFSLGPSFMPSEYFQIIIQTHKAIPLKRD